MKLISIKCIVKGCSTPSIRFAPSIPETTVVDIGSSSTNSIDLDIAAIEGLKASVKSREAEEYGFDEIETTLEDAQRAFQRNEESSRQIEEITYSQIDDYIVVYCDSHHPNRVPLKYEK